MFSDTGSSVEGHSEKLFLLQQEYDAARAAGDASPEELAFYEGAIGVMEGAVNELAAGSTIVPDEAQPVYVTEDERQALIDQIRDPATPFEEVRRIGKIARNVRIHSSSATD